MALKSKDGQTSLPSPAPEASESVESLNLVLAGPGENDVVTESPSLVSGITKPNIWVAISAEEEDYIIKSNDEGTFEQEVEFEGGLNQILITAFDGDGTSIEEKLTVVFSTEFSKDGEGEEEPSTETAEEEATEAADAIREKVQLKIEEARKNPKAYLGTVTDMVESNIQIKSLKEEILQVSVDEEKATFIKVAKTKSEVKFSDIAIGDFIIAMGYKNSDDVLEATRILLTEAPEPTERKIVLGGVDSTKKGQLTLTNQSSGQEYTIEPGDEITVTAIEDEEMVEIKFADIEEDQTLIVVGEFEEEILEARRIHIIFTAKEETETEESSPSAGLEE